MGRMKDLLIQQQEQGWSFVGKNVCAQCFTDMAIRDFVTARTTTNAVRQLHHPTLLSQQNLVENDWG